MAARRGAAAALGEAAAAALGGGGRWPSLQPWRWCWYGGDSPVLGGCLGGEKIVVLCDLGFLSLYRFPNSRHQILGFNKTGIFQPSGFGLGRILGLDP